MCVCVRVRARACAHVRACVCKLPYHLQTTVLLLHQSCYWWKYQWKPSFHMAVYLLSCSVELFLQKQNNVLWAQTWVSGRAKSQTKWNLVNTMARGQLEFQYSPKTTVPQARLDTVHCHYARSNCFSTFLPYFSQWYPLNASGLWYKEGNSLFVLQDPNLLAPYASFLKNNSYDHLLRFCYLWLSISGGCSHVPFSRLTSELWM